LSLTRRKHIIIARDCKTYDTILESTISITELKFTTTEPQANLIYALDQSIAIPVSTEIAFSLSEENVTHKSTATSITKELGCAIEQLETNNYTVVVTAPSLFTASSALLTTSNHTPYISRHDRC
jgi:hypothetical protein